MGGRDGGPALGEGGGEGGPPAGPAGGGIWWVG